MSKDERYFSGMPPQRDPNEPLPGEVTPQQKKTFQYLIAGMAVAGVGVVVGLGVASEPSGEKDKEIAQLKQQLGEARGRVAELERTLEYGNIGKAGAEGQLDPQHRRRHERVGRRYVAALRRSGAQPAADLMEWFIARWNNMLDHPGEDDRVTRRAAALTLLVTGMAKNLHPDDYVPWQAEFFGGNWLGELHVDVDGDGLPGKRSTPNRKEAFADRSICHIAMALNQAVTNAQVLIMPNMKCDATQSRMSVFLAGKTYNDALTGFVKALKEEGFLVVERMEKRVRLILIGNRAG